MEQGDHLPIYASTSEQTRVTAPLPENTSSSTDASTPLSETQLLLSMVNTLVDSRLSSILPQALVNSINAVNPATQIPPTSHLDMLNIL